MSRTLSTKNLPESKGLPKTLQPSNTMGRINNITLEDGFEEGQLNVVLHLESPDLGENFEGFLVDKDNPNGGRYRGQIGRVKIAPFAFSNAVVNGRTIDRDLSILQALKSLASALGKTQELDLIEAATIEQYVKKAAKVLSGNTFLNWCLAGKEYLNKEGYTNYELFLPKAVYKVRKAGEVEGVPYENIDVEIDKSKLYKFDPVAHIRKKKAAAAVTGFSTPAPTATGTGVQSDFDLD
jgi:hypothetical protein